MQTAGRRGQPQAAPRRSFPAPSPTSAPSPRQYPDLRATENFQQLQRDLNEIEDEIQASRRIYNSNVQSYNTKIQIFPNSVSPTRATSKRASSSRSPIAAEREPVEVKF